VQQILHHHIQYSYNSMQLIANAMTTTRCAFEQKLANMQAELEHERAIRLQNEQQVSARIARLEAENRTLRHKLAAHEQKQAAAQHSARLPWAILNSLPIHIAVLDMNGTIIAVNAAWRTFGAVSPPADETDTTPPHTDEGANYLTVCDSATGEYADEAPRFAAGIRAVLAGTQPHFTLDYPCHTPTEQHWFTGYVTRLAAPDPPCVVTAHADITDRKRAELALQTSERRLRRLTDELEAANRHLRDNRDILQTIIDTIDDGFVLLDHDGYVRAVNRAMTLLLGRPHTEVLKQPWATLCRSVETDAAHTLTFPGDWVLDTVHDGQPRRRRERIRYPDGITHVFDMQTLLTRPPVEQPPFDQTTGPTTGLPIGTHVVLYVADITERLQQESQARHTERTVAGKTITALVAHRVNTPLQTIQATLEMLAETDEVEQANILAQAREQIERIGVILRELDSRYRSPPE
jgi:PAS domain-containing protein